MIGNPFVLLVELWIAPGRNADFESFEVAAASIMRRHGGRIERRVGLRDGAEEGAPDEVHVVAFPSRADYEAYRNDPALAPLAELRARAIVRTVIREGADMPPFGG
jgi:uncharacterized protein (DUF1330 family)